MQRASDEIVNTEPAGSGEPAGAAPAQKGVAEPRSPFLSWDT
jgi:hypothetical protein